MSNTLIGLLSAVIGAVVGALCTYFTLRFNYKSLYAQHVSDNRMQWINVWRESLSQMLACADTLHKCGNPQGCDAETKRALLHCYEDFCLNRNRVILRLNMTEDMHKLMFAALNTLNYQLNDGQYELERDYIIDLARKILKPEWERVKLESKGKR